MPIRNVYMKSDDVFPSCRDFHVLLRKPENKIRLQSFLQLAFQKVAASTHSELIYCVVGNTPLNLTTGHHMPELECTQAEADTAMFSIYSCLRRSEGYKESVVVDTEDTDNYVQAAYVAHNSSGLLCLKRKHQLIDARHLCSEAMAASIIPLHVLTGCDHNSGFYGVGKKLIADRSETSVAAQRLLSACGTQLPVTQSIINDLEQFVIQYVYNDTKSKTLGEVRAAKWRAQKKSIIRLIPDSDSLRPHLERANYLGYVQRHYQLHNHPSPITHGWHLVNGLCLPVRHTQPPLPPFISLPANPEAECITGSSSESDDSDSNGYSSISDFYSDRDAYMFISK